MPVIHLCLETEKLRWVQQLGNNYEPLPTEINYKGSETSERILLDTRQ